MNSVRGREDLDDRGSNLWKGQDRLRPFNEYTNESFLQRQELPPAHIFDGGVFARKRKLLENWSGNDFCMGEDVRAVVFGGKKSLHIDDPIQLEMVRVLIQSDS